MGLTLVLDDSIQSLHCNVLSTVLSLGWCHKHEKWMASKILRTRRHIVICVNGYIMR